MLMSKERTQTNLQKELDAFRTTHAQREIPNLERLDELSTRECLEELHLDALMLIEGEDLTSQMSG